MRLRGRTFSAVALFFLLFGTLGLTGCQTQKADTREAQADLQILQQKKTPPSPTTVTETLKEPQPGYNQDPGDTQAV